MNAGKWLANDRGAQQNPHPAQPEELLGPDSGVIISREQRKPTTRYPIIDRLPPDVRIELFEFRATLPIFQYA